jgi:hypothetical protein
LVRYLRRRDQALKDTPLSTEEQRQADTLLHAKDSQ